MTVRINKDAINLREKLSQLDKPSGLVGEELLRADTSADAREALNLEEHLFEDFESTGIDDNATSTVVTVSDRVRVDGGVDIVNPSYFSANFPWRLRDNGGNFSINYYNTSNQFVIKDNGNVGIGTASPDGDLDVRGAGLADLVVRATSANSTSRVLMQNDAQSFALRINGDDKFRIKDETSDVDRLVIDTSGNVGIGTASPSETLHVYHPTSNINALIESGDANVYLAFKDSTTTNSSSVFLGASGNNMTFHAGGTERARIDSSGNLLVGTTAINYDTRGIELRADGRLIACRDAGTVTVVSRNTTDGTLTQYRKDGSEVGSINTNGGSISLNSSGSSMVLSASGVGFHFDSTTIRPFFSNDASVDLGLPNYRYKDLYLSGGVITSSDYRLKEDVQPMQSYANTVKQMNLVNFAWKDTGEREDGFIAHELQALIPSAVRGDKDAIDEKGNEQYQGVDPLKLIPVLTKALQEALERIETLENK